jgi:hypothetical protein
MTAADLLDESGPIRRGRRNGVIGRANTLHKTTWKRTSAVAMTVLLLLVCAPVAGQAAQGQRPSVVRIVVHDATDLPVRGAEVTLTAIDGSTIKTTTDTLGEASFENVEAGAYSGRVESPGFNQFVIEQFSARAGARVTRQITLQVAGLVEKVDVTPDADDERLMSAFSREFTREELAALPEDREDLALTLRQLLGDDADIRVDGFSGGRLPPGSQIREIRVRYDVGAASSGGGPRVEIRTSPGGDRWRNSASMRVRDAALNARDPLSGERPAGDTRQYSWSLNGPLVRGRTGLSVSIDESRSIENQTIYAAAPGGIYSHVIEQPSNGMALWASVQHQFTPAQSIRVDFSRNHDEAHNQGIGQFDLPERAFTNKESDGELRVAHHAAVGRRYVGDIRLRLTWDSTDASSLSDARTIRVLDAFTSGGAQQEGGHRSRTIDVQNEHEFSVGRLHRLTAGVGIQESDYRGDDYSNRFGTYTFASLAAFEAGQPTTFTERVGNAGYAYSMRFFEWHLQDDYRVRRNLMLNLGLRDDFQTHLHNWVISRPG